MIDFGGDAYLWIKALHTMSFISWMAALLYLPRLFVYHTQVEAGSQASETFKVMERRLEIAIMTPAGIATWVFGLLLMDGMGMDALTMPWLVFKLILALGMVWAHVFLMACRRAFAADRNSRPENFYRVINEAPTILMIGIVILAVVKPF